MKRGVAVGLLGWVGVLWAASVCAEPIWQSEVGSLSERDIRQIVPASEGSGALVATNRHVYRFISTSKSWKQVLGVRTPDEVVELVADPQHPLVVWLATQRTLRRSTDGGQTWKSLFRRDSESGFKIRTIVPENTEVLLVGTTEGLYRFQSPDNQLGFVEGSPKGASVDSLVASPGGGWVIGTSRGIYKTTANFKDWELVSGSLRSAPDGEEGALGQFAIEEIAVTPIFANAVVWPKDGRVFMARQEGVFEGFPDKLSEMRRLAEADGFHVRHLAADERFVYLATDRGVYRMEPETHAVENISQGLESLDVSVVAVEPREGRVWAGTHKGLFQLNASEIQSTPMSALAISAPKLEGVVPMARPASEPTITQIQQAAVRYAEVSPDKIRGWREAAAKKAWLPTVSLDTDFGEDYNVDIDRGGTNDPDKFITGPKESNLDWSVGVSWDLGNLIWNDDQTSIDVRSRLMVELRNDVLNDVTHLYFERRRVQMELAALSVEVPKLRMEKELKLEELTAQIDALTGSYLSRRLSGEGVAS